MLLPISLFVAAALLPPGAAPAVRLAAPRAPRSSVAMADKQQRAPKLDQRLIQMVKGLFGQKGGKQEIVCGATKYGCDPRGGVDENAPPPSAVERSGPFPLVQQGIVGQLEGGVEHLNALLEDAGEERAVILKFKREGCPACNSTIAPLASAAAAYAGRCDFVEVDYTRERAFCRSCRLAVVPCAHIYIGGELADAMPLGPRAWAKFAKRLGELVGEPAHELVAAEIPSDRKHPDARSVAGLDKYL